MDWGTKEGPTMRGFLIKVLKVKTRAITCFNKKINAFFLKKQCLIGDKYRYYDIRLLISLVNHNGSEYLVEQ